MGYAGTQEEHCCAVAKSIDGYTYTAAHTKADKQKNKQTICSVILTVCASSHCPSANSTPMRADAFAINSGTSENWWMKVVDVCCLMEGTLGRARAGEKQRWHIPR